MTTEKIKRWIKPSVLAATAYHVQDAVGLVKLDAMENPYQWPEELKRDWLNCLARVEINRYPSADAKPLKEKLKKIFAVPPDHALLLGNGSDEIIQIITMACAGADTVLLAPQPSFSMYEIIAAAAGGKFAGVPLGEDYSLDLEAMLRAVHEHNPAVVFLAYPNNPTANLFPEAAMIEIIRQAPGIVVVDEAYHIFADRSLLPRLPEFDNLLILRTLSKIGLAGLRLGYLAGPEPWIREFEKLRLPYNINMLTQVSADFILNHFDVLLEQADQIKASREKLYRELQVIPGIEVWPSSTNFLLFRAGPGDGNRVFEDLLHKEGVLIKNLGNIHPSLRDCLRVTVGTEEENAIFLRGLHRTQAGRVAR